MSSAVADLGDVSEEPGKIRRFLRRFVNMISRLLRLKMMQKTASGSKKRKKGKAKQKSSDEDFEPQVLWSVERRPW